MNFRDRYIFDSNKDLIGKGGFARVYKAYDSVRNRTVALKFYHGVASKKYDIISEINRMEDIVHPNLIRYYDASIIESVNVIGEVEKMQVGIIEYADSGDISTFFRQKRRSEKVIRPIILDILKGLQYLHTQNIAHRDLKPKNILLSNSKTKGRLVAKIADFGISKQIGGEDHSMSSQLLGSVEYMAPEQFAPVIYGTNSKLATNMDLWSFGVILYEIFMGKLPFGSRTKGVSYEQILNNILFNPLRIDFKLLPTPYNKVLERCLVKKSVERAQIADELIAILEGKRLEAPVVEPLPTLPKNNTKPIVQNNDPTEEIIDPKEKTHQENYATTVIKESATDEVWNKSSDESSAIDYDQTQRIDAPRTPFNQPKKEPKPKREAELIPVSQMSDKSVQHEINVAKNLFKLGNYPESFKILDRFVDHFAFDTEARFYLGFMYYNGKCGGAHDVKKGRAMMQQAKRENRPLVIDLMRKYVL